jgi:glycosyltransferase involved in cell wall biosynthesis
MLAFQKQGHRVISLSQASGHKIHDFLNSRGIETHSYNIRKGSTIIYFLRHILYFIRFCRKRQIDIVYSHLEPANFVAALSRLFVGATIYVCRHHIDEAVLQGFDTSLFYRLTYRLAKKIIVVSDRAVRYMRESEKIKSHKIIKINLAYDFGLYPPVDLAEVEQIRSRQPADVRLLTISRFTKHKRADLSLRVLRRLVDHGLNANLTILGKGEEEEELRHLAEQLNVSRFTFMPGYVDNVRDYMAASTFLLHPSVMESSCVTVKEAALTNKTVIVCSEVGDFEDYIANGFNGFIVNRDNFIQEASDIVLENYQDTAKLISIGANLEKTVRKLFSIDEILKHYLVLNSR